MSGDCVPNGGDVFDVVKIQDGNFISCSRVFRV